MLDQTTRTSVLRLREAGHGSRAIARALGISRGAVKQILKAGTDEVPLISRKEKAEPHEPLVRELFAECAGNLVRVHEELQAKDIELSYAALTGFCRRHKIGHKAKVPSGHYHFDPGEEMQHDTSPHQATIGGAGRLVQTAVLVLCCSRMLFFQAYLSFTRFFCKLFLTDALEYLGGSCARCMIDNTHVVVLSGTGADMVPVPEMAAFADRFGFAFAAHEKGDANRSARVERPMDYLERNFYAGRKFADLADLNAQAVTFCDKSNARWRRHLHASPRELYAAERPYLKRLPIHVPEVYLLHHRIVDVEGYVTVARHRYSVPAELIGRQVEVRETRDRIEVFRGPRRVAGHERVVAAAPTRVLLPEHRVERPHRTTEVPPEEGALLAAGEDIAAYVKLLKQRLPGLRATLAIRRLLAFMREYPERPFREALATATHYGLVSLDRLEGLILRAIQADYFVLHSKREDPDEED
ncbi:MAG TPA: IS21 family transposase [Dehalococcoidia bacterium]|nr:IS21 family transposase [Dehalococcoidia bacterium]